MASQRATNHQRRMSTIAARRQLRPRRWTARSRASMSERRLASHRSRVFSRVGRPTRRAAHQARGRLSTIAPQRQLRPRRWTVECLALRRPVQNPPSSPPCPWSSQEHCRSWRRMGDTDAQFRLGYRFAFCKDKRRRNLKRAFGMWKAAAEQGDVRAKFYLGTCRQQRTNHQAEHP